MNQHYKQPDYIVCPLCKKALISADASLICSTCNLKFRIHEGIPVLLASEAEHIQPDVAR
jgi:uncharacterized protein YbaR (Trm112 family)